LLEHQSEKTAWEERRRHHLLSNFNGGKDFSPFPPSHLINFIDQPMEGSIVVIRKWLAFCQIPHRNLGICLTEFFSGLSRSVAKKMFKKSTCLTSTMAFPFTYILLAIKECFISPFSGMPLGALFRSP
jgi:hypothetical protein